MLIPLVSSSGAKTTVRLADPIVRTRLVVPFVLPVMLPTLPKLMISFTVPAML